MFHYRNQKFNYFILFQRRFCGMRDVIPEVDSFFSLNYAGSALYSKISPKSPSCSLFYFAQNVSHVGRF